MNISPVVVVPKPEGAESGAVFDEMLKLPEMKRFFLTCIEIALLMTAAPSGLMAQVPLENIEKGEYPAHDAPETKEESVIASFFEEINVGNLHVFPSFQPEASYDYYFRGDKLSEGMAGLIDPDWRAKMPEELTAYAVYTIKGDPDPYYILRFEGKGARNSIELFEMVNDVLEHRQTLAMYWCKATECIQQDAWLQDADGDTLFDLIKKVNIRDSTNDGEIIGEYHVVMEQLEDGSFVPSGNIPIDLLDYQMEEPSGRVK